MATRIGSRVLLLTAADDSPSYLAARSAFERIGVPFEVLDASDETLTFDRLYDDDGGCRFQGVVLSTDSLGYEDPDSGLWVSAMTEAEWGLLDSYEFQCAAREVAWYAYPDDHNGLEAVSTFDADSAVAARLADAGKGFFRYLNPDLSVAIEHVYGYRATIVDPARTTALLETDDGYVLAALHTRDDGTEVASMTLDSGTFSVHSQLVEYGLVQWLTSGVFLGKRRAYLAPQIDDVFLHTNMWNAEGADVEYRMTATDVAELVAWQQELLAGLPEGSDFVTHMVFNGAGTLASIYPDTEVVDALRADRDEFEWINHTWSHLSLDELDQDDVENELRANCELAEVWDLQRFDCESAVTPHISGLDNPAAVAAMEVVGVRYVVSDTSVTAAINPDNPGDNPSHNTGRPNPFDPAIYQVPRHPTSIFYSTSTIEEQVGLYNELYRDFWGRDLTYDELIEVDSDYGLRYLLTYDIDPLMFHQANLRALDDGAGGTHTIYGDWIERVLERYLELVSLPVLSPTLTEIGREMEARAAYDACGAVAYLDLTQPDQPVLLLSGERDCVVPVTGVNVPELGRVEVYGGEPTTHVELEACATVEVPWPEEAL